MNDDFIHIEESATTDGTSFGEIITDGFATHVAEQMKKPMNQ